MYNSSKNIVLIGMPGCGKTTIGKLLAKELGRKFIDIDNIVEEQVGCTINELFRLGEEHFRNLEAAAVLVLEKEESSVIAAGGGIVKRASNMESLKKNGMIVFIDRSVKDIAADIDATTRPLLANGTGRLAELYAERYGLYKKYSDFIVANEGKMMEVVENIKKII
ncbi:MAG TPA: shikimate kinase [Clostridia bacterium]|nr:shikimate kinase [Clostridia bacterium]